MHIIWVNREEKNVGIRNRSIHNGSICMISKYTYCIVECLY